jgi:ubiquinone/menaquinone biosynthesis C-methylase UbiE
MTKQTKYVFEPFAETADYRAVNGEIVRGWVEMMRGSGASEIGHLLDITTGVGTMVQLFLIHLPRGWKQPSVVCLDKSTEALEQVKEQLNPILEGGLQLLHSSAEEIHLPDNSLDVVVWGNGIHYLDAENQEKALRSVRRILRPGGWFFFNSAFYAESRAPETLIFYRAQVRKAVQYLHALGVERERKETRPKASNFLPLSHYENLLEKVGFKVEEVREVGARLYRTTMEHISNFQQYAAGALHGYRAEAAAEAMREAVALALEEHGQSDEQGKRFIPRNWLAVGARVP